MNTTLTTASPPREVSGYAKICGIVALILMVVCLAPLAAAQMTSKQVEVLKANADRLLAERRFGEAAENLKTAYRARPDPNVLGLMVMPYLAQGLFPEASDALGTAIAEGAEVGFTVRHNHSLGYCYGTLFVGPTSVRFAGGETFQVARSEISKADVYTLNDGNAGTPLIRMKLAKKNWKFTYALYGGGQYESDAIGNLVYRGDELAKAQRASELIVGVIQQLPTAAPSRQVEKEEGEINITMGMTRDEVIQKLGQPQKAIVFGSKTILKYPDITVQLQDDKVVDVSPN